MPDWNALLQEALPHFRTAAKMGIEARTSLVREIKADGSIVTSADRQIEAFLRQALPKLTPGAGFWGEEEGFSAPTEAGQWLLDPIDGTSNYSFGMPLWGVTGAFLHGGRIKVGINIMPELGWETVASQGGGALLNGSPIGHIPPGPISSVELVSHGDGATASLINSPGKMRHMGAFVTDCTMVALQQLRAMTTGRIKLYDCAGTILVCRELGADIRHFNGELFDEGNYWMEPQKAPPMFIGPRDSNFPFGAVRT